MKFANIILELKSKGKGFILHQLVQHALCFSCGSIVQLVFFELQSNKKKL